jgi:hypothetical protein
VVRAQDDLIANMRVAPATDPKLVAQQAAAVAAAWSPPGAPSSWRLTAAQFEVLRDDQELLAIAATIPPDQLPCLLFEAAATFLVLEREPTPLREWFPTVGEPQATLDPQFAMEYRAFCLDHRESLLQLCASHRYQMNEVARCADVIPALPETLEEESESVLVDIGTGAGLALHLDRYRYVFRGPAGRVKTVGDAESKVLIETEVRGSMMPPIRPAPPQFVDRIGIDIEPLDISVPAVRAWLAACVPQEIGAVTRFHSAAEVAAADPVRTVRGDADEVLADVLAAIPAGPTICLLDTYVHVFFGPEQLQRFRATIEAVGAQRDVDWISVDPLIPMGPDADRSVLGIPVPSPLLERNRSEGVFGVIGRLSYRDGRPSASLLGAAHPGGAWLEWFPPTARIDH